jgi:ABC-type microcin C transport system duplicated ATPase subunit YejF
VLAAVGLEDRARHRPDQLSVGEQQRVVVARALVHRLAVLWPDEPAGNLDSELSETVLGLLLLANRDSQTIVLITHNPGLAIGYRSRDAVAGLVAEAIATATIGVVVGVGAGLCMGCVFAILFGSGSRFNVDTLSLATALGLVCAAALLVTAVPAWRLARLDPASAIRHVG